MNFYIITGASKGLGDAIARQAESKGKRVYSLSRSESQNGIFKKCDLSDPQNAENVINVIFDEVNPSEFQMIVLINNVGTLHPIKTADNIDFEEITANLNSNLLSAIVLCSCFIKRLRGFQGVKKIVNITSGAARKAYHGWSLYCASKAGLEQFSRCLAIEQSRADNPVSIVNVDPVLIDTDMQALIRNSNEKDFPDLSRFIEYKNQGKLADPETIASRILTGTELDKFYSGETIKVNDYK
ncbi:MAG: SDR family NAD(P)-dependent oxidoreductase [candidate division Zixibacteria bacterium]|nr:SDR family NAD(P)-dependent oxidoreductase [candidate division Zixibacteria bacterium]